jgi:tetratricopeptide (TPR) repeat protein
MSIKITTTVITLLASITLPLTNPARAQSYSIPTVNIASNANIASILFELPQTDTEISETRQQSFNYILKGLDFEEEGEEEEAQEYYKAAIEADSENGWGWLLLGRLLRDRSLVEHAYSLFDQQNEAQGKAATVKVWESITGGGN